MPGPDTRNPISATRRTALWLLAWASTDAGRECRTYLTGFSRSAPEGLWSTDRLLAMRFPTIEEARAAAYFTQGQTASPPLAALVAQEFVMVREVRLFGAGG